MRFSAAGPMVVATGLLVATSSSCTRPAPAQHPTTAPPTVQAVELPARPVAPDPRVGAVFLGGGSLHACTGGVLDSPGGNLIITAAHCMAEGIDAAFVSGFNNDAAPEDVWHVDAVYLDPRWMASQDPLADFAIASVSRQSGGTVQAQAGGGLTLGHAPKPGTVITVSGYGLGVGGGPVGCRTATAPDTNGFPSLACAGLVDGLSGAPWIDGSTATGVIGGLDGGGCNDKLSYSPPFDDAITGLLARAEAGGPADAAPTEFAGNCD
ncbi:trypsin-like serine protease [Mycobacterium sp.]|uniref:trypsin-like serine peptidase n=1 Tax=Mycobacterium sp. TaxID=1785 RepID=UPI003341855E